MIKVNLLKNRAVVGGVAASPTKGKTSGGKNLAEDIKKAGLSNFSFSKKDTSSLDGGFDTFECSPLAQFLKLVLLVGFVVPLVAYEKMRANSGQAEISSKNRELQSYQTIQFDKQKALSVYTGLNEKKDMLQVRAQELFEIKKSRLTALFAVDELQTAVPSDVWLTAINFLDGGRLDVSGQTLLDSGLDRLVTALKASPRLDRINVQQDIKTKSKTGRTLNEFKITMFVAQGSDENRVEDLDGR